MENLERVSMGLRSVAAQEITTVTDDPLWLQRVDGGWETFMQVSSLPERLDKWKGVWLLLSDEATMKRALRESLTMALQDAMWLVSEVSMVTNEHLRPFARWLLHERLSNTFDAITAFPAPDSSHSDPLRIWKSVWLLSSAFKTAAAGQSVLYWGTGKFDLSLLKE